LDHIKKIKQKINLPIFTPREASVLQLVAE